MNPLNPKKLLHSKWTAVKPVRREKHFIVTDVQRDEAGVATTCTLQAVHSKRDRQLAWRELRDADHWRTGWQ